MYLLFNSRHWNNLKHEKYNYSFLIKLSGVIMVIIFLFPVFPFIFVTSIGWIKFCHDELFRSKTATTNEKTCKDYNWMYVLCFC